MFPPSPKITRQKSYQKHCTNFSFVVVCFVRSLVVGCTFRPCVCACVRCVLVERRMSAPPAGPGRAARGGISQQSSSISSSSVAAATLSRGAASNNVQQQACLGGQVSTTQRRYLVEYSAAVDERPTRCSQRTYFSRSVLCDRSMSYGDPRSGGSSAALAHRLRAESDVTFIEGKR